MDKTLPLSELAKIGRGSVTEETIEYLKDQIPKQKLKSGQQLPCEESLASRLGVGRGTLREALRVLIHLGFIERHNKATTVTSIAESGSPPQDFAQRIARHRDVMKVVEVCKIVEPEVAALAAERADDRQIAEIGRLLEQMARDSGSIDVFADVEQEMYRIIKTDAGEAAKESR